MAEIMRYYLFAKFFQQLSVEELMAHCVEAGIDGPTALIRDGYWIEESNLAVTLPPFVRCAESAGLEVHFASTGYALENLAADPTPLRILADNGITAARVGYVRKDATPHVRGLHDHLRGLLERTAESVAGCGVRLVVQLHGGFYPHNATAAYFAIQGLDPKAVGIMIDPGNNIQQEGYEHFPYQIQLVGSEYLASVGTKDACMLRSGDPQNADKGWRNEFVPVFEGRNNWHTIYRELRKIDFSGPMILMPFYDADNFPVLFEKLKREVAYLRNIESAP